MGCFWCSEDLFIDKEGVYSTHVGYMQGKVENPTYHQVCSGTTGHSEVVRVVYDPSKMSLGELLKIFWTTHDPTTLNRQGNDSGTQYRSGVYYYNEKQKEIIEKSKNAYASVIPTNKSIKTEIQPAETFYYGEDYHQQYDRKPNSRKYCGLSPLNIPMPENWNNEDWLQMQKQAMNRSVLNKYDF